MLGKRPPPIMVPFKSIQVAQHPQMAAEAAQTGDPAQQQISGSDAPLCARTLNAPPSHQANCLSESARQAMVQEH